MALIRFPQLHDREWLSSALSSGESVASLAKKIGCSTAAIIGAARKLDVPTPSHSAMVFNAHERNRQSRWPQLSDFQWMKTKHDDEKLSLKEIAALIGCSVQPVRRALNKLGISAHSLGHRRNKSNRRDRTIPLLEDRDWVTVQLVEKKRTLDDIAAELNCSIATVGRAARRHRIQKVFTSGRSKPMKPWSIPQLLDESWLRGEYILKDRKARSIAKELHCSVWSVQAALGRFRILKFPDRPQDKIDATLPTGVTRKNGYILVFSPEHPYANGKGYVPQHRLIAEQCLGRILTPLEEVHHLNEKKDDNRPENLLVFPTSAAHMAFHANLPAWVPRCECCARPRPELIERRPDNVPLEWTPESA